MHALIDFPAQLPDHPRERFQFGRPGSWLIARRLEEVVLTIAAAHRAALNGAWVVGVVAYEAAPAFDTALQTRPADNALPLAAFAVFDHAEAGWPDVAHDAGFACGHWTEELDQTSVTRAVEALKAEIMAGRHYQTNLTMRLHSPVSGSGAALFAALHDVQPDGYSLYLDGGNWQIASVSPELFFDWQGDQLITRPMKGTAPRHADHVDDLAAAEAMRHSPKERAENLMIVDLLRNDLARIAVTGSVQVPALFAVEALPSVWQMTSTVRCTTRPGLGLEDVFKALFPCGSITGAPKVTAMQAIAERESSPRGAYCGALGIIRPGGHATFNVGIRTVNIDAQHAIARCGIGSGITIDSNAAAEYAEWQAKRRFLLRATAHFSLLETLRLKDGDYWLLERHLARIASSAAHFGFAFDEARLRKALADWAGNHAHGTWRVRLLGDRNGEVHIEGFPLEPNPEQIRVALAAHAVSSSGEFLRHKTTERSAYTAHSIPQDCFDVLLWNERSELTEFTKGNVVVELDGRRLTPALPCGLLNGVLRQEQLAEGEIEEAVIHLNDLQRATRLWFINGVRGMLPADLIQPV